MIVEVRTYTIKRGHRAAVLDALKGPTFAELKRIGVRCAGPWPSAEDDQKLVWVRAFPDAAARQRMTNEFYAGTAWTGTLAAIFMPVLEKHEVVAVEMDEAAVKWDV